MKYQEREPEERIDRYAGPYERWVFSNELGRPYSFPMIAGETSGIYTALMEGGEPQSDATMAVRLPPLWNPTGGRMNITPFAFQSLAPPPNTPDIGQDAEIARFLGSVRRSAQRTRAAFNPRFRVNFPIVPEAWVPVYLEDSAPDTWTAPATPPRAIVAVIDDGLPFAHRAFLDSTGRTRISHCWLQSGVAEPEAHVPFGREFVNTGIDLLRADLGRDEGELYRRAGAIAAGMSELGNHLRRSGTHGSHILGLAAGNDTLFPDHPMGDDIQIIAVQLPNTIAWDTSGFGKEMYMLSAIHYVFERASRIAAACGLDELPLILNFSYGWSAGRHDGQSEMEIAIQDLLAERQAIQPDTAIIMPTGNNFASEMHARLDETNFDTDAYTIGWQVQPDDKTSSYLELWFPEGFNPDGYAVTLTPPHGVALDLPGELDVSADPGTNGGDDGDPRRFIELEAGGEIIGQMSADHHRGTRWRVMVALVPTAFTRGQGRRAPSGLWHVTLSRTATCAPLAPAQDLLIWLQRDDDPSDLKSHGRQSYLVDLNRVATPQSAERPPAPTQTIPAQLGIISGYGALNGVASSAATTRVAGYVQQTGRPAIYSGAGGLRTENGGDVRQWGAHSDVIAVSDHSAVRPGIPSIGVLSGARARLIGTSCAAPSVARLMACNAAAGRPLQDGFDAQLPLPATERPVPNVEMQYGARTGPATAPPVARNSHPTPGP